MVKLGKNGGVKTLDENSSLIEILLNDGWELLEMTSSDELEVAVKKRAKKDSE